MKVKFTKYISKFTLKDLMKMSVLAQTAPKFQEAYFYVCHRGHKRYSGWLDWLLNNPKPLDSLENLLPHNTIRLHYDIRRFCRNGSRKTTLHPIYVPLE